jgi:peptide/nickel transport system permease protein
VRFVRTKILQLVVVLFAVSFLTFMATNLLPGDTAISICGGTCQEEDLQELREELGLNDPLLLRYKDWLSGVVTGDLGESAISKQDVWEALQQRMPVTLELILYSQVMALGVAVPAALLAARRPDGWFDRISSGVAFALFSLPVFFTGFLLILIFAVGLNWFPAVNYTDFLDDPYENLRSLFLPALALALADIAIYLRLLRSDLIATLQEDYIAMAKAKGIPERKILLSHAFRPSTFSLLTVAGLNLGRLVGGTLVIDVIFGLNGLGKYVVDSILRRDYIPLQGAVLVIAVGFVTINFIVDLLYAVLDPRIRHARANA